jgi:murein DD-endopeptidase MepM/ murein hydrolase activator NlpD
LLQSSLIRLLRTFYSTWWFALGISGLLASSPVTYAQGTQAPVEVRVPLVPQPVAGSDGLVHVAYELHVTNYYPSTGTLHLQQLTVWADDGPLVLGRFVGPAVNRLLAHPATSSDTAAIPIEAGKRVVLYLWLTLPANRPRPRQLRHQLVFIAPGGKKQLVDGLRTALNLASPVVLGAPLRAGPWFAYAGPGNPQEHHWNGVVVVNGQTTIPQRYATDFYGLTPAGHVLRRPVAFDQLSTTTHADWVGFGADVLAVADGIVRDARDGEPNRLPMGPQPALTDLTERILMGNFIVLEVAPGVFAHYAHLQPGSLRVKVGDRVRRGAVLGRLGQSGQAPLPHLHFQVSNAVTFEESEGLPFVFRAFERTGSATLGQVLDQPVRVPTTPAIAKPCQHELPLDGDIIVFK